MHLRLVNFKDAENLAFVHQQVFDNPWTFENFESSLQLSTTQGWILEDDTKCCIGFILSQIVDRDAEILTLAISPLYQGQGLGHLLCRHLLQVLKISAVERVFLEVAIDNSPALKLYKTLGFHVYGQRKNYYQRNSGAGIDAYLMELKIAHP